MSDLSTRAAVNSAIDNLLYDGAPNGSILPSLHNSLLKDILDTLDYSFIASGTVPSSVVVTLTDTLTFDGGSVYIDNSNVVLGNNLGGNQYTLQVNQLSGKNYIFGVNNLANDPIFNVNSNGEITAFSTTASVIGSEKISLQNRTLVQGAGTAGTNIAFEVYDSDTTPNSRFEVRSNGDIYTNSNQGLSATYTFGGGTTGDIASMTFTNGLLTAVTTVL